MAGFGVVRTPGDPRVRRIGWRAPDGVVDLGAHAVRAAPALAPYLLAGSLDPLLAAGRAVWEDVVALALRADADGAGRLPEERVEPVLGFTVADYVDFYSSEHHATNVGRLFRPGEDPLPPSWRHLPIGYHGRAGTVVVSGTPVRRPSGQRLEPDGSVSFGPSRRLDLEAELGFVVGAAAPAGRVGLAAFADHVFGVCLVNDWSARDLQAWEYRPLGPFLGKSFATSVSPWVVPLGLLDAARVRPPERVARPLPYLDDTVEGPAGEAWGLDVRMRVHLDDRPISSPPVAGLYWTGPQQLAHLSSNGAALRTGDLFATGTVSGPEPHQWGSLLELTRDGATPLALDGARTRGYLEDGDEVTISATAPGPDGTVDLGEVRGRVLPAATDDRPGDRAGDRAAEQPGDPTTRAMP